MIGQILGVGQEIHRTSLERLVGPVSRLVQKQTENKQKAPPTTKLTAMEVCLRVTREPPERTPKG